MYGVGFAVVGNVIEEKFVKGGTVKVCFELLGENRAAMGTWRRLNGRAIGGCDIEAVGEQPCELRPIRRGRCSRVGRPVVSAESGTYHHTRPATGAVPQRLDNRNQRLGVGEWHW